MRGIHPTRPMMRGIALAIGAVTMSGIAAAVAVPMTSKPSISVDATPAGAQAAVEMPDASNVALPSSQGLDDVLSSIAGQVGERVAGAAAAPSAPLPVPVPGLPALPDPAALVQSGLEKLAGVQAMIPDPAEVMAAIETCRATIGTDPTNADLGPCITALRALLPDPAAVQAVIEDVLDEIRPYLPGEVAGPLDQVLASLPSVDEIGAVLSACIPTGVPDAAFLMGCVAAVQGLVPDAAPGLDFLDDLLSGLPVPGLPGLPGGGGGASPLPGLGGLDPTGMLAPLFDLIGMFIPVG
jgi:hypothetical protein